LILKIISVFIVLYIFYKLVQNIPKTEKQKLKEEIRSKKRRDDYLLGISRQNEYHYHNDCELVTRYNNSWEYLAFSGSPSVFIGDKISLVWYSDRLLGGKTKRNYFYKDYQVHAFEEFTFDENNEYQIIHRIISKDTDYLGLINKNDYIYIEEKFRDGKIIMSRMELGDIVRFDEDPQKHYTLKYESNNIMYVPLDTLQYLLVKEVVELKKLFQSGNKPRHIKLSKRKLFFNMVRCRDIPIDDRQQVIQQVVEEEGDVVRTEINR